MLCPGRFILVESVFEKSSDNSIKSIFQAILSRSDVHWTSVHVHIFVHTTQIFRIETILGTKTITNRQRDNRDDRDNRQRDNRDNRRRIKSATCRDRSKKKQVLHSSLPDMHEFFCANFDTLYGSYISQFFNLQNHQRV